MNISEYDETITNDEIISKADNTYIMLLTAIMQKNLSRVDHKIGDYLYNKYQNLIDTDNKNNVIHMYDELNVKTTSIEKIEIKDNKIIVKVKLISRYLNYFLDIDSKLVVNGDNTNREEHINILTFEKSKNANELQSVKKCPGCGNSLDISYSGKCEYCGSIFDTENYDYVLIDLKEE